jgi:hypothetical protein
MRVFDVALVLTDCKRRDHHKSIVHVANEATARPMLVHAVLMLMILN